MSGKKQVQKTTFEFKFENGIVESCESYKYLGVTLNEHLDFDKTTEVLCESAGRSLGGIITKMIKNGGPRFLASTSIALLKKYTLELLELLLESTKLLLFLE